MNENLWLLIPYFRAHAHALQRIVPIAVHSITLLELLYVLFKEADMIYDNNKKKVRKSYDNNTLFSCSSSCSSTNCCHWQYSVTLFNFNDGPPI